MRKMATEFLLKLNLSLNTIQLPSSSPSPNYFFKNILTQLNEWLAFLPNLFHGLVEKFNEAFSPEKRAHWLAVATPFAIAALGIVLAYLLCCCFLPAIISCVVGVVVTCWNLAKGSFMLAWRTCARVCRACCCCGTTTVKKMMKPPGRVGHPPISRSLFESAPKFYFRNLRAGNPVGFK